jgi:hypothetical protein
MSEAVQGEDSKDFVVLEWSADRPDQQTQQSSVQHSRELGRHILYIRSARISGRLSAVVHTQSIRINM